MVEIMNGWSLTKLVKLLLWLAQINVKHPVRIGLTLRKRDIFTNHFFTPFGYFYPNPPFLAFHLCFSSSDFLLFFLFFSFFFTLYFFPVFLFFLLSCNVFFVLLNLLWYAFNSFSCVGKNLFAVNALILNVFIKPWMIRCNEVIESPNEYKIPWENYR